MSTAAAGVLRRDRRRPAVRPALWIAAVYLVSRAVTTGLFLLASALAGPETRFGDASAGLGTAFVRRLIGWDAQWYWLIAENGYPAELPRGDDGEVAQNAWAFMPIYPFLARALGVPLGGWGAGAVLVSLAAGYLSALALYRLLRPHLSEAAVRWSVLLLCVGPLSPLFQVGYAEALFLLWLLLALCLLQERRYGWIYPLVILMGYTRPGVLAFALTVALFGLWRIRERARRPIRVSESVHILGLGALATVVGFSWPVIVSAVTGEPNAYFATELSWRRLWVGGEEAFVPFSGWFQGAEFWFGAVWGLGAVTGVVVAVLLLTGTAVALLLLPSVVRLGPVVRLWAASYLLYLVAVFFPQSSLFRLLFPLAPLWGAVGRPRRWWARAIVVGVCLLAQWCWVWNMYGLADTYWRVP